MSYNIDINTGHLRDFNLPAMSYIHVWIISQCTSQWTNFYNRTEQKWGMSGMNHKTNTLELLKIW